MLKRIMDLFDKLSTFATWMSLILFILYSGNKDNNVFLTLAFICIPVCVVIRIITFVYALVVSHNS